MFAMDANAMAIGASAVAATAPSPTPTSDPSLPRSGFGTLRRENVSGLNRICVYDTLRGEYSLTVKSDELCPLAPR